MSTKTFCECGGYYSSSASKWTHMRTVKHTEWKVKQDSVALVVVAKPAVDVDVKRVKKIKVRVVKPEDIEQEEAPKPVEPKPVEPKPVPLKKEFNKNMSPREWVLYKSFGDKALFQRNDRGNEHELLRALYAANPEAFNISELHSSPSDPRPRYTVKVSFGNNTFRDYHIYTDGSSKRIGEVMGISNGISYTLMRFANNYHRFD